MKTFKQFINEGLSRKASKTAGNLTGCYAISLMYEFLETNVVSGKFFKADRIEDIGSERYLVYTFDKDKFEKLTGITLSIITEDDAMNESCYRLYHNGYNYDIDGDWLDDHKTRWGLGRRLRETWRDDKFKYILIFVIDKTTNCVSTIEYANNVKRLNREPESLLGTYLDNYEDFSYIYQAYDPCADPETAELCEGCITIEKVCDFFKHETIRNKELFKADRIEDIRGEQNLIYTLDAEAFKKNSRISLDVITEDDITSNECYRPRYKNRMTCGWVDSPNNTKWGITINGLSSDKQPCTIIFVIDRKTKRVSTIEYAEPTSNIEDKPESLLGTYLDNYRYFFEFWIAYHAIYFFSYERYESRRQGI